MVSGPGFDFSRQRIVVADDVSATSAFVIDALREDGHRVSHVGDTWSAISDLAFRDCHLFICGSGIGARRAIGLIDELRGRMPGIPILCLVDTLRWRPSLEVRLPADVAILREPFTADVLRGAVRPLLPLLSTGTIMAWPTKEAAPLSAL